MTPRIGTRFRRLRSAICGSFLILAGDASHGAQASNSTPRSHFVPVGSGVFQMGAELWPDALKAGSQRPGPHWDEAPVHEVRIRRAFAVANAKVTQAEFARFRPGHEAFVKSRGLYWHPDAPAVMVTWAEASEYCRWVARREGAPVRLPTEAEWEFAARQAEALGLRDIGDGIMEWCLDWWAPYSAESVTDPLGPKNGEVRVTRNGDWFAMYGPVTGSPPGYGYKEPRGPEEGVKRETYWWSLYGPDDPNDPRTRVKDRSRLVQRARVTDRSGTVPADRRANIGFRVVRAPEPDGNHPPPAPVPAVFGNVSPQRIAWKPQESPGQALFFAQTHIIPPNEPREWPALPYFGRHHVPSLTWCDNGDLLLLVFSTPANHSDQMVHLMSRLRRGANQWDPPARSFVAPDRNIDNGVLYNNGRGEIHYYLPLSGSFRHEGGWHGGAGQGVSALKKVSTDHGASWSAARIVHEYPAVQASSRDYKGEPSLAPFMSLVRRSDGALVLPSDLRYDRSVVAREDNLFGSVMFVSEDNGETWKELTRFGWNPSGYRRAGGSAGWIAGLHNPPVELSGGRWLSFGRHDEIAGRAPMSLSEDGGRTWKYSASPFPSIAESQKQVMIRLAEGPILLVWFTDPVSRVRARRKLPEVGMEFVDTQGRTHRGYGMFATVSFDEGRTWPVRKLIPGDAREPWKARHDGGVNMAAVQTPDGVIHLATSSHAYHRFNLAWLKAPMPPP